MSRRTLRVLVRVAIVAVLITVGFGLLQQDVRSLEMRAAIGVLDLLGAGEHFRQIGAVAVVLPERGALFAAVLTPSCSALASVLAIISLGVLLPKAPALRRTAAVGVAAATIVVGNLVRIVLSLAAGLIAGRSSLVLFHDVAGAAFTFVYVLTGYVLMLMLLLPRPSATAAPVPEVALDAVR